MIDFDRLQTPPGDGDVLIEPAGEDWSRLLEQNRGRLADWSFEFPGVSAQELRAATHTAVAPAPRGRRTGDAPIIAAGHQPEFVHPGVWAKHVVVHHAAERLGGVGLDFVVDNDAPARHALIFPRRQPDGMLDTGEEIVSTAPAGSAYEGRPSLADPDIERLRDSVIGPLHDVLGEHAERCMLSDYLAGLAAASSPADVVDQHVAARRRIDESLDADLIEQRVSRSTTGPFVADLLIHADRFAADYNAALADYRERYGVRGANRPLPDLGRRGDSVETALWVYQLGQPRRRLWVARNADAITCFADQQRIGTVTLPDLARDADASLRVLGPWVIRPRALTLTLWARLLACDLFVHGIGGAKYDRITDGIIRRYYACEAPEFACVSATLRLPLPRFAVTERDLVAAQRRLRDLRYNPQRYIQAIPADLLRRREDLIEQSRRLRLQHAPALERRRIFLAIRETNAELLAAEPDRQGAFAADLRRLQHERESNVVADTREYFYALQPRDRLERLAARLVEAARLPARR